jgi:hypothetical protein
MKNYNELSPEQSVQYSAISAGLEIGYNTLSDDEIAGMTSYHAFHATVDERFPIDEDQVFGEMPGDFDIAAGIIMGIDVKLLELGESK